MEEKRTTRDVPKVSVSTNSKVLTVQVEKESIKTNSLFNAKSSNLFLAAGTLWILIV